MIKFCQKIGNYFSTTYFPYNPKGYKDISKYITNHEEIESQLPLFDLQKDYFTFAYNNFLNSIQDDDFKEYVYQVCDKQFADQFIQGLSKIQYEELKIEKIVNDQIQEQIYFSDVTYYTGIDRNKSLYDHKIQLSYDYFPKMVQLNLQTKEIVTSMSIGAFIKSKLSIKIQDLIVQILKINKHQPDTFHHVRFMVLKEKEEKNIFQQLKSHIIFNYKEFYIGNNPTWKIIDMDKNMEKQYPQFF